MDQGTPAFFDIGNTLAAVTDLPGRHRDRPPRRLPARTARAGRAARTGRPARDHLRPRPDPGRRGERGVAGGRAGHFFVPDLVIYGRKDSPEVFQQAAQAAGSPPRLLFVGEDAGERAQAVRAGFTAVPHPRLAAALLDRPQPLRFVRITVPPAARGSGVDWSGVLRDLPLLPVHVRRAERRHALRDRHRGRRGPPRRSRLLGGPARRRGRAADHRSLSAARRPAGGQRVPRAGRELGRVRRRRAGPARSARVHRRGAAGRGAGRSQRRELPLPRRPARAQPETRRRCPRHRRSRPSVRRRWGWPSRRPRPSPQPSGRC